MTGTGEHRLDRLTTVDVDDRPLLLVPVGSCEQHGPHLPLGTDTLVAAAVAAAAAARLPGSVVAPALAITASGEHAGFAGTLSIGTDATHHVLVELVRSAGWAGWVVLVNGHGGNRDAVDGAVGQLTAEGRPVLPWWPSVPGGDAHAGRTETSLVLAIDPDLVAAERAAAGETAPLATLAAGLRAGGVGAVSPNGVLGDPAGASAEHGRTLLAALVDDLVAAVHHWQAARDRLADDLMRYRLDDSTERHGHTILGGSPLRLFRLSAAGADHVARLLGGDPVDATGPGARLVDRLIDTGAIHPVPGDDGPTPDGVTVVVPAHDADPAALAAIVAASAGTAAVVVVDDASVRPIGAVAGAEVVRLDRNAGPGAARNAGLAAVGTPFVAFVDTDVTLSSGWLTPLLGHLADPRVALVAPRVASADGDDAVARYERDHSPLDLGPSAARVAPGSRVSYVPAAAIVVRTDALRAIGGFDPALRVGEDVDAVWRLVEAGWRCRYEPAAVVHHRPRPTWRALIAQRIGYGSSAAPLARRHPGAVAPVRVSGWTAVVWALAGAGHPLAAAGFGATTAAALVRKLPDLPVRVSLRLAGRGHVAGGRLLADAVRRAWWPLAVLAALVSRRARRIAALAAVPALLDGGLPRLVDDLAYGAGVWRGVLAEGEVGPLVPDLRSWPGRRPPADPA